MSEQQHTPTQHQRWFKYGLNVAVLVLATLTIIVLVNWMGYRHFQRFDFTRTRQYSLSPQTVGLLDRLESDIQVTTFYVAGSAESELLQRVDDLLTEYTRRSARIQVSHIDPAAAPERRDQFIADLQKRYESELEKAEAALKQVTETYDRISQFAQTQTQTLPEILAKLPADDQATPMLLTQLNQVFLRIGQNLDEIEKQIQAALEDSMPDYQGAASLARNPLSQLSSGVLDVAVDRFQKIIDDQNTADPVKDALLGLIEPYRKLRETIQDAAGKLDAIETPQYTRVRNSLMQSNCVVVTVPPDQAADGHGVVVLTLDEIYPNRVRAAMNPGEVRAEEGYKGEETITGAILRLTLKHDTRIVFVNPRPQSVLSGRGNTRASYSRVAQRLRRMNFDVGEWQPGGSMGPMGQPAPPQPAPQAQEGQTLVFVVLPAPPPNPQRPTQPVGPMIAQALSKHLEAGQPALVFLSPNSMMSFGQADPVAELIKPYGITVDTGRVVLTKTPGRGGRMTTTNQLELHDWPDAHPISRAARGLNGLLLQAMPIDLPADPGEGLEVWPLATTPPDTWADTDYFRIEQATRDEGDPVGPFTVAAAAQKGQTRMVAIADVSFAVDEVTGYGPRDLFGNTVYTMFPGNSEVFVNSMYWLAGLDELIAPGARTQDIRRIDAVSRPAMLAVWWITLAGLPALCLAAGGVVWMVRRR